ncbi:GNAT family N-acetyltransferase [Streptomyces sp. ISL-11]|uniref:GNAT family N-acetyltransferase n=1 Tax=Streptomyces sp. ISL-11 TaxID=2819174 RepID=UPI002036209C|nr:GNAT family N-acetyltransferase [Streptomyces sp. ISL-11]
MTSSPTGTDLTTDRLVLRTWSPDDITAVLGGIRLPHWAPGFPAEGDRVIASFVADRPEALDAYGQRQIIERESGLVVGAIGLFWPPDEGAVDFGYGVVESRRGLGYASEAARAIVEYAFSAPGVHTVRAEVELSNPASVRVQEKAGLRRRSADGSVARFGVTAAEFARG